jgi:hypothetical protein
MAGLDPAIHAAPLAQTQSIGTFGPTWIRGSSPRMTKSNDLMLLSPFPAGSVMRAHVMSEGSPRSHEGHEVKIQESVYPRITQIHADEVRLFPASPAESCAPACAKPELRFGEGKAKQSNICVNLRNPRINS